MLPASTLVLAAATIIPFGLAIRDTLADTSEETREPYLPDDVELDDSEATARYALHRVEQALERQLRAQRIRELVGREVATPGPLFSSIHLGDPVGTSSVESTEDAQLMLLDDGVYSLSLSIKLVDRNETCDQLERRVHTTWGTPPSLDKRWIWVGASQRAVWRSGDCSLTFERISSLQRFVTTELPLAAIGKPAQALLDDLGDRANTAADDQLTWSIPGIGTGYGVTQMTADVKDGKIVAVTAALHVDLATRNELSEQITHAVGQPPAVPTAGTWSWKPTRATPPIKLVERAPQLVLTVGSRPE